MEWYKKAVRAANRIDPAHTTPWKLASTYALLSIAESLASGRSTRSEPKPSAQPGTPTTDHDLLTVAEVAEVTRQTPSTLRYWRCAGHGGAKSFKLGRRILYRR